MASQLLAANFFIARTTAEDSGSCHVQFLSVNTFLRSRYLHSGSTLSFSSSSSSSSPLLHIHRPGYGGRDARLLDGYTHATSLLDIVESTSLQKGREKRTSFGIMTESMLSIRNRKDWRFQSKLEDRIYHGLGHYHHWNPCIKDLHSNMAICGEGSSIGCQAFLSNFLKRGFSMADHEEKQRERDRQRAFFSVFAQAMVALHMAQSPLLSFLWASVPSMANELCTGGQVGGKRSSPNWQEDGTRKPAHTPFSSWKVLLLGLILGTLITMTLTSSASLGALLDSCFWLCLLCSFLYLVACTIQAVFFAVMFVARGGIMSLCKSFNIALRKNVCVGFSQGLSPCRLWSSGCPKNKVRPSHLALSSLWSISSAKVDGYKLGSTNKGGLRQVYSQLRSILPKQVKL